MKNDKINKPELIKKCKDKQLKNQEHNEKLKLEQQQIKNQIKEKLKQEKEQQIKNLEDIKKNIILTQRQYEQEQQKKLKHKKTNVFK